MSMALPAELNGYPGPRHVLDLATSSASPPISWPGPGDLFDDMRLKAIELGEQIVAREALLDELFASGTATKRQSE